MRCAAVLSATLLVGCASGPPVIRVEPGTHGEVIERPACTEPPPAEALDFEALSSWEDRYHEAVATVLLPGSSSVLELIVIPSFRAEEATYLEADSPAGCRVTHAVARESVWHVGYDRWMREQPAREVKLPGANTASATISSRTCQQLRALWDAALSTRAKPSPPPPAASGFCAYIHLDGVAFHLRDRAGGVVRAGVVPKGDSQPFIHALVELGEDLGRFVHAPPQERVRLDAELGRRAEEVAAQFRRGALAP